MCNCFGYIPESMGSISASNFHKQLYENVSVLSIQQIAYLLSVLVGVWDMSVVTVVLVVFGEIGFIVKTSLSISWCHGLLLGNSVMGT